MILKFSCLEQPPLVAQLKVINCLVFAGHLCGYSSLIEQTTQFTTVNDKTWRLEEGKT